MQDWDSRQYLKFEKERTQPAIDLASRVAVQDPKKIVDIGCGPGNSTQVLAQKYPNARIIGADNSQDMIEAARKEHPGMEFVLCDAGRDLSALGGGFDIVFSNACIQWVPDHETLIPGMMALLKKGGVLAVQILQNFQEPIHLIVNKTVTSGKWKEYIRFPRIFHTLTPDRYFDLLSELTADFSIWEVVYYHTMRAHQDILEWYRGTGLRPFLNVLPDNKKKAFEQDILTELIKAYPVQKGGGVLFKFPRLFFTAVK